MAAFKQFNTNEVVITPFYANKGFRFGGSSVTASDVGINYYQTRYGADYVSGSFPTGLVSGSQLDQVLVFNSIKQLYYSNYLTRSTGDPVTTQSLVLGYNGLEEYDQFVGPTTGPRFDNFLQTSQTQSRYFAQFSGSGSGPSVISIPSKLYGEKIPCGTFKFEFTSSFTQTRSLVIDDGEGNLMATYNSGEARPGVQDPTLQEKVGDIFYSQGIAVFTGPDSGSLRSFARQISNSALHPQAIESQSIEFSSSITIKENQYKCVIRDNQYSYTLNPSALRPVGELSVKANQLSGSLTTVTYGDDGTPGTCELSFINGVNSTGRVSSGEGGTANVTVASDGTVSDITVVSTGRGYLPDDVLSLNMASTSGTGLLIFTTTLDDVKNIASPTGGGAQTNEKYYDFATGSYFSPYVTTVGLYNKSYELVAVGKFSQPLPISLNTDTTFVVNFDTW